jgi:hypothetical protein
MGNSHQNILLRSHWANCNQTGGMVLGWPPSKIVSGDPDFQPRNAAKLKIEKGGVKF